MITRKLKKFGAAERNGEERNVYGDLHSRSRKRLGIVADLADLDLTHVDDVRPAQALLYHHVQAVVLHLADLYFLLDQVDDAEAEHVRPAHDEAGVNRVDAHDAVVRRVREAEVGGGGTALFKRLLGLFLGRHHQSADHSLNHELLNRGRVVQIQSSCCWLSVFAGAGRPVNRHRCGTVAWTEEQAVTAPLSATTRFSIQNLRSRQQDRVACTLLALHVKA